MVQQEQDRVPYLDAGTANGLAAIVNGIYNKDITKVIGDASVIANFGLHLRQPQRRRQCR